MKKPPPSDKTAAEKSLPVIDFPVVGIGASAGGLEAMEAFFRNVSTTPPMAFVVVQHMAPKQAGYLVELLQSSTSMPVIEVSDRIQIEAKKVYVIPPNKGLSLQGCTLRLFDPSEKNGLRLPIDAFFKSLADELGNKSIGVILSGMGSDGSRGLLSIQKAKGITLVQSPETAKFPGMPSSATRLVPEAITSSAEELHAKLLERIKSPKAFDQTPAKQAVSEQESIKKIVRLLLKHNGHDFSHYKTNTLNRRIERRKGIHQIDLSQNYATFLEENPTEASILFKELLIGVTSFFRDKPVWTTLKEKILPELMGRLPNGYAMRMWIPACSTGEEAYSLAIVFRECLSALVPNKHITLQIFATDLDSEAIVSARRGVFSRSIEADVSSERLNSFFLAEGDNYKIKPAIREMIVFAVQNITSDPPFTKLDLLSCRNLLIYLETPLQQKIISLFHYSIRPHGIMLLGSSETIGTEPSGFIELDSKLKIFQRTDANRTATSISFPTFSAPTSNATPEPGNLVSSTNNIQTLAEQVILRNFAPPSLLVNSKGDIVYVSGPTGKYLEPAVGKANWNVHAMARQGLREILPGAFRAVLESDTKIRYPNLHVGAEGGTQIVNVTAQRIDTPPSIKGMVIIVFEEVAALPLQTKPKSKTNSTKQKLEAELQSSFNELQRTREEMQTSQEELKSMNEELQSTNEELQSTNEELTTSKEEMQSLNEELQTMNAELQNKVRDHLQTSDDMKNLLNSTEIATLFLDKDLYVRRFTDQVTNLFKLREVDIGRPFTELVTDLQYPEIDANARQVLKTLGTKEDQVPTNDGRWFSVRIMPYRTTEDLIDGLVITFTDISVAKQLEKELMEANQALTSTIKGK